MMMYDVYTTDRYMMVRAGQRVVVTKNQYNRAVVTAICHHQDHAVQTIIIDG